MFGANRYIYLCCLYISFMYAIHIMPFSPLDKSVLVTTITISFSCFSTESSICVCKNTLHVCSEYIHVHV